MNLGKGSNRGLKEMHNEVLHNFNSKQNFITMMKSSGVRWVGHVADMGYMKKMHTTEFYLENLMGDQSISEKIKAVDLTMWTGFVWLRI